MTSHNLETARLVRWRINSLEQSSRLISNKFMIGKWYWHLEYARYNGTIYLTLKPKERQNLPLPIASYALFVFCSKGSPITTRKEFRDMKLSYRDGNSVNIYMTTNHATIPVICSVEFLDLKKEAGNGPHLSIFSSARRSVISSHTVDMIRLTLSPKDRQRLQFPIASVTVHVFCSKGSPITTKNEFVDLDLSNREATVELKLSTLHATIPVTVGVEFLDLKMKAGADGKSYSIWDGEHLEQNPSIEPICRMFSDSICTDIVIHARDGSIDAHRAVLAANSPVFKAMFSKNYKEKETSTIDISDMSIEACKAMLNFAYGKRESNELRAHNVDLIFASDKYDIMNLKSACDNSLCEDVGLKNVFERLICAHTYDLVELKRTCLVYLVKFGMIFELREDYNSFLREADPELIVAISNECLDAWQAT